MTSKGEKYVKKILGRATLSNSKFAPPPPTAPKKTGIRTHDLCVSAAVLYQLIYEDQYIGSRPIC